MWVLEKTTENSKRLGLQARLGFEPGTSRLPVLSITTLSLVLELLADLESKMILKINKELIKCYKRSDSLLTLILLKFGTQLDDIEAWKSPKFLGNYFKIYRYTGTLSLSEPSKYQEIEVILFIFFSLKNCTQAIWKC